MLKSEEIFGKFHEKELQKTNQTEFRVEIVIKKKGDTQYVKFKNYDNLFHGWMIIRLIATIIFIKF